MLKPDGTLWVIGSYHNIFRIGAALQDLGFWILNDIVWRKTNPMPNFRGRRFTNAHETLIWAARDQQTKRYTFNYEAMKALNDDLQMRTDWLLPLCTGGERLKGEDGKKAHPTQKPEALLVPLPDGRDQSRRRRARSVLRHRHDRRRGQAARPALHRHRARPRSMPRSPASASRRSSRCRPRTWRPSPASAASRASRSAGWSRAACCSPAPMLGDHSGRLHAPRPRRRHAVGANALGEHRGSIHQVGAAVQGAPACNGWTFWHFDAEGGRWPIDHLRQQVRAGLSASAVA